MTDRIIFDEAFFDQKGGVDTGSTYAQMWETLAMSPSWINAHDQEQAIRTYEKVKRRRERENCLHGAQPFPIRWAFGVRPGDDKIVRVMIDSLSRGPYLLSEEQHSVLHEEGEGHTHV